MLLNELDQFVKRELRCPAYVRYVDDFLLFGDDKQQLWAWKEDILELLGDLRLVLHPTKSVVYPVQNGIPFLGFRVWPALRRLKRANVRAFVQRLRQQGQAYARGELPFEDMNSSVQSWVVHASHGDTYRLRTQLFRQLPITLPPRNPVSSRNRVSEIAHV